MAEVSFGTAFNKVLNYLLILVVSIGGVFLLAGIVFYDKGSIMSSIQLLIVAVPLSAVIVLTVLWKAAADIVHDGTHENPEFKEIE